jgi:hypothetical protein
MLDVSFFGWLLLTLPSVWSAVLVLLALAAVTYLGMTATTALRALPPRRPARVAGLLAALPVLVLAVVGLRVGDEWAVTLAVGLGLSTATGATVAGLWSAGARGMGVLSGRRASARARALREAQAASRLLAEKDQALREGDDLRAEVAEAEVAVERLRGALGEIARARDAIDARLEGLEGEAETSSATEDAMRARDDLTRKMELGDRVLKAAEAAAFRLACTAPVRRLLRRRPKEPLDLLEGAPSSRVKRGGSVEARADAACAALEAFVGDVQAQTAALDDLAAKRPASVAAGGDDDPLERTRRELEAMETAYSAVLRRVEVVRLRIAGHAGLAEVASAAEDVSNRARAAVVDEGDLQDLAAEVSRADAAVTMAAPGDREGEALADALAMVMETLEGSDPTSLVEIAEALRELG